MSRVPRQKAILLTVVAFAWEVLRRLRQDEGSIWWIRVGAVTGLIAIALQSAVEFSVQMPGNAALFAVIAGMAYEVRVRRQAMVPDDELLATVQYRHDEREEAAAAVQVIEYLKNSPYKDKLADAGLFLRVLGENTRKLRNLIQPHGQRIGLTSSNSWTSATALIPRANSNECCPA